jgi:primary-amine oxidase
MSLQESTSLPVRTSKQSVTHPLAPLSAQEIQAASSLIYNQWPENTDLQFKVITLNEPAKAEMVPFLEAEFQGQRLPSIDRRVMVAYYIRKTVSICL